MNTKLRCLLLDDELPGLTYLKMVCEEFSELEIVKAFNDPETFLKDVPNYEFDLCILDIEMPGMNGLEVASLLNGKPVIFTTAYKEYAAAAFDIDAVDYVQKPVKKERLQQAINKALERIEKKTLPQKLVRLNTDKGKAVLLFDQVNYIKAAETDSRDKLVRLNDATVLTLKNITFRKLLHLLPAEQFCRVNKKEVIALRTVKFFSHNEITTNMLLPSGKPIAVILSESYRNDFIEKVKL